MLTIQHFDFPKFCKDVISVDTPVHCHYEHAVRCYFALLQEIYRDR